MARRGSLSDFWRQDASDDRVRELTSVLRGSDSLIGVMGSGVRAVWSTNGESQTWWVRTRQGKPAEMRVFLDYSPLRELTAPFSGEAVDEVIGYAAHEELGQPVGNRDTGERNTQIRFRVAQRNQVRHGQREVLAYQVVAGVADKDAEEHLQAQTPVGAVDLLRRQRFPVCWWFKRADHVYSTEASCSRPLSS